MSACRESAINTASYVSVHEVELTLCSALLLLCCVCWLQLGGSEAIISALVRGLEKHGGRLMLRAHVDEVIMEGGRAAGVALRPRGSGSGSGSPGTPGGGGKRVRVSTDGRREVVRARRGVISNASVWDTQKLLPEGVAPPEWKRRSMATPQVSPAVRAPTRCMHGLLLLLWLGAQYWQMPWSAEYLTPVEPAGVFAEGIVSLTVQQHQPSLQQPAWLFAPPSLSDPPPPPPPPPSRLVAADQQLPAPAPGH
jgi:hypothetical protein